MTRRAFLLPLVLLAAGCGSDAADEPAARVPEPTGTIAYACGDPPRLCTIRADGTGRERPTRPAHVEDAPDWAPDGTSVVVSRIADGRIGLYRVDVRTGVSERITPRSADATYGRFSPDGTRLVFLCPAELGMLDICVSDADGSGTEAIRPTSVDEIDPDWSPDGSRIVFTRYTEPGPSHVFVMDADGGDERRVAAGLTPAWSPDGETIAVSGDGLRLVDVESGDAVQLTQGQFDTEPSWSPDGRWLVFRRGEFPTSVLYVIGADGEGERRLTVVGEPATMPSWGPAR